MGETTEPEAHVNVDGYCNPNDYYNDDIARDPGKGQSIPEWSDRKRTERTLGYVGIIRIDEGQSRHENW